MMRRLIWTGIGVFVAVTVSFFGYRAVVHAPEQFVADTYPVILVSPDGVKISVAAEIADGDAERSRGLMFRDTLPETSGMIFIFSEPRQLHFWMKNTLVPLDILYFDDEGTFVSRTTMVPCMEDPCPFYSSQGPSQYALEVNAGEPVTLEVGNGWKIETDTLK